MLAPPAQAGTAAVTQNCERHPKSPPGCLLTLRFTAAAGETNDITVGARDGQGRGVIEDAAAPLTAGSGCESTGPRQVTCVYDVAVIDLGDGADRALIADIASGQSSLTVDGGDGDDALTGGNDNDTLKGGPGSDVLAGAGLDDRLDGGPGGDVLRGGDGHDILDDGDAGGLLSGDLLNGGAGVDTVDYSRRTGPLTVDLQVDQVGGEAGESDELRRIEAVKGGFGDDTLIGSGQRDILFGELGDDRLHGLANRDSLSGGPGDDLLDGGSNRDNFDLFELPGGGQDRVVCGTALDFVADPRRHDLLEPDCERINAADHPNLSVPAQPLRVKPHAIVYRVACSGSFYGCIGRLEIRRAGSGDTLGAVRYRYPNNEDDRYLKLAVPVGHTRPLRGKLLEIRLEDAAGELCDPCRWRIRLQSRSGRL